MNVDEPPKAIFRVEKLKTMGNVGGSLSHNYRNRLTLNADDTRTHLNEHSLKTHRECFEAIKNRIPEKHRSDAVLCIEHLVTASPQWTGWGTEKEKEFWDQSVNFLKNKYGEENLISTTIHRDETTPHMVAYVVPVDKETGRLNCKKWLGGTRKTLSKLQTEFHNKVKHLGLERGVEGSLAKHKTIKQHYAEINKAVELTKIEKIIPEISYKQIHSGINWLDSGSLKQERLNKNVKPILNQQFIDIESQFREVEKSLTVQLRAKKIEVKEKVEENQKAIRRIKNLENRLDAFREEMAVFIEFKGRFPQEFKYLESDLKDKINEEKQRLIFEEHQREHRQQQANLRRMQEEKNRKNHWVQKIESEAEQGLENFLKTFNEKITFSASELEKQALRAVISEVQSYKALGSNPRQVLEIGKNSENSSPYYVMLHNLAYVKSESQLESFISESLEVLKESKRKGYDDTSSFHFYDKLGESAPSILALETLLAQKIIDYGDESTIGYNAFKDHLSEALIAKSLKLYNFEYDKLESDQRARDYSKELQATIKRTNGVDFENDRSQGRNWDFD